MLSHTTETDYICKSKKTDMIFQETCKMSQETDMVLDLEPGKNEFLGMKAKALFMLGRFIMVIALHKFF